MSSLVQRTGRLFNSSRVLVLVLGSAPLTACMTPKNYVLSVDARDKSKIKLCTREAGATETSTQACPPFTGGPLQAPGVLAVVVDNADSDRKYQLRVNRSESASSVASPEAIVREVLTRAAGIGGNTVTTFLAKQDKEETNEALKSLFSQLSSTFEATKPRIAALIEEAATPLGAPVTVSRTATPKTVFKRWIDANKKIKTKKAPVATVLFGTEEEPPVRNYPLRGDDLTYLAGEGVNEAELAAHSLEWCAPSSFGNVPYDKFTTPWEKWPAPSAETVLRALLLDEKKLKLVLDGKRPKLDLSKRAVEVLNAAATKLEAKQGLLPEESAIHGLFMAAAVADSAKRCSKNLQFLIEAADTVPALVPQKAALLIAKSELDKYRDSLSSALVTFQTYVEPLLIAVTKEVIDAKLVDGNITFAAMTLNPGKMEMLVVQSTEEVDETLAQVDMEVKRSEWIAVAIGPTITMCTHCIQRMEEVFVTGAAGTPTRRLRYVEQTRVIAPALAVHLTLADLSPYSQIGALLGYPLDDAVGTFKNVLVGLSYRHSVGFLVSAGVQFFEASRLKEGYGHDIDASVLTVEDVTTTGPEAAFFTFVGLTTDVFGRL